MSFSKLESAQIVEQERDQYHAQDIRKIRKECLKMVKKN